MGQKRLIFKKIAGFLLIILGIIGLFLPILQGVAMIILGGTLLLGKEKAEEIHKRISDFFSKIKNKLVKKK